MTDRDYALQYSDMGLEKFSVVEECVTRAPAGLFLEVGTRRGGSAIRTMQLMPKGSTLISVDPYGDKRYVDYLGVDTPYPFPDSMYMEALQNLSTYALNHDKNFVQYKMTSVDFLQSDFVYWTEGKGTPTSQMKFSFVLLDGDHTDETVRQEVELLTPRMVSGGIILIDNIDWLSLPLEGWERSRYDMAYKIH